MDAQFEKHTIVVVDDNRISTRVTTALLRSLGASYIDVENGEEAIEVIQISNATVVFMNLFLKGMDGFETVKEIRSQKRNSNIPVVAVTQEPITELTDEMMDAGFTHVLSRPLQRDEVIKILDSLKTVPIFDYSHFTKTFRDEDMQRDIVHTFFDEEESDTKRLRIAFETDNKDSIYSAIHYMKGSFSYLKAAKILIVTQKMLDLLKSNKVEEAMKHKDEFMKQYFELLDELRKYY